MNEAHDQNTVNLSQRRRLGPTVRLEALLFLCLWLGYGTAINSDNLIKFNLQQIGVEALVERHQVYLEVSSVPELWPGGDVFFYQGHKFAAKQPGQTMAGALVYWVLRAFGLRYENNYLLTSALVTFFTTSLMLAGSAVAVFRISRRLTKAQSLFWPMLTTLSYALATTIFAYSGIAHHDALATGYLVLAFYLIFDLPRAGWDGWSEIARGAAVGLLLGLAVTTSMLVSFMVLACVLYFLWLRRWKLIPLFAVALLIGLLPLFIYDARSFGNPFLLPNVAGAHLFADAFFRFSAKNFGDKIVWYTTMVVVYAPVLLPGIFGLSYYPRSLKRTAFYLCLVAMVFVLVAYITNIQTGGDCQFGPRYLMPAMPFVCLGIAGYSYLSSGAERRCAGLLVLLVGLWSFGINLVGAVLGAMNCPDGRNALRDQLGRFGRGEIGHYPFALWLLAPLVICSAWFVWSLMKADREHFVHRSAREQSLAIPK